MAQTVNPALGGHLLAYSGVPTFMRQTPTRDLSGVDAVSYTHLDVYKRQAQCWARRRSNCRRSRPNSSRR